MSDPRSESHSLREHAGKIITSPPEETIEKDTDEDENKEVGAVRQNPKDLGSKAKEVIHKQESHVYININGAGSAFCNNGIIVNNNLMTKKN